MTTPTGTIRASDVNVELGRAGNTYWSMNDGAVRGLSGQSSGYVDMWSLRGKSSWVAPTAWGAGVYYEDYADGIQHSHSEGVNISIYNGSGNFSTSWSIVSGGGTLSGGTTTYVAINKTVPKVASDSTSIVRATITDNSNGYVFTYDIAVRYNIM